MNKDNVKIDWTKYVDAIYCIHFLPYWNRLKKIEDNLQYIDVLDSPIFSWHFTYPNAFDEIIASYMKPTYIDYHTERRRLSINVTLAYHNIFREIQEIGYDKVLIIEDDCTFIYNRKSLFIETLENLPENWDYIQFDKARTLGRPEYFPFLQTLTDGKYFLSNYTGGYWGTTFTLWSKKAIDIAVKKQEKEFFISDHLLANRIDPELSDLNRYIPKHSFIYQASAIPSYYFS